MLSTFVGQKGLTGALFVLVLAGALPLVAQTQFPAGLNEAEYEALLKWNRNQQDGGMGTLLNPPVGSHAPEVAEMHALMAQVMEALAGPELRKRGIKINLSIYAGGEINAFARQWKPRQSFSPEKDWRPSHAGSPWPMRRLYGVDDKENFYEIGFSTALLGRFSTIDELAFVMAHELIHILEGHTVAPEFSVNGLSERWWSAQQYEVVADLGAMELMKAKFALSAVIKVLDLLATSSQRRASVLKAATSDHHQSGERLSIVQLMEQKYLEDSTQNRKSPTPIPASSKVGRAGPRSARHPNFAEFYATFRPFVLEIARDPRQFWIGTNDWTNRNRVAPKFRMAYKNTLDLKGLFIEGLKEIDAAEVSGQNKVEGFFKLLQFFATGHGQFETHALLDALDLQEKTWIRNYLARNISSVNQPIDELIYESAANARNELQAFQRQMENKTFKEILTPLIEGSAKWRRFPRLHARLGMHDGGRYAKPSHLAYVFFEINNPKNSSDRYDQATLDQTAEFMLELSRKSPEELAALFQDETLDFALVFGGFESMRAATRLRTDRLAGALNLIHAQFALYRNELLSEFLKNGARAQSPEYIERIVIHPAFRDSAYPLPSEIKSSLEDLLLDKAGGRMGWRLLFDTDLATGFVPPQLAYSELMIDSRLTPARRESAAQMVVFYQPVTSKLRIEADVLEDKQRIEVAQRFSTYIQNEFGLDRFIKEFVIPGNSRCLSLIGRDPEFTNQVVLRLTRTERLSTITAMLNNTPELLDTNATVLIKRLFASALDGPLSLPWMLETLSHLRKLNPMVLSSDSEFDSLIRTYLVQSMKRSSASQRKEWLKTNDILKILSPKEAATALLSVVIAEADRFGDRTRSLKAVRDLSVEFKLADEHAAIYREYKEAAAFRYRLQPHELETVFIQPAESITVRSADARGVIRGISALIEAVQKYPAQEQLDAIKFLLGETSVMPDFFAKEASIGSSAAEILGMVNSLRMRLMNGANAERVFIVNSILTGPDGMLRRAGGLELLKKKLFASIRSSQKDLATDLLGALINSYGPSQSLPVSFILARKGGQSGTSTDADFLLALLVGHGAPGIKFGQFLGFTEPELEPYLGKLQDSARELSYLQAVEILEARFGKRWEAKYEFIDVLGTGSVNAALALKDKSTGKMLVMSVAYPNIEAETAANFERIKAIIRELTRTPEGRKKYGHLTDLIPLIEDSVRLEFNKANALAVMKEATKVYHGEINGWKISTVAGHSAENMSVLMDMAGGTTARRLKKSQPAIYAEAMAALGSREQDLILGQYEKFNAPEDFIPYVNPDFHDGQVLIDIVNKRIVLLDFGQGTFFTHGDQAFELLRSVSGIDSARTVHNRLLTEFYEPRTRGNAITLEEVQEILSNPNRMSRFVRIVGRMRATGGRVPLDAVNWVFAVDRQHGLSKQLDSPKFNRRLLLRLGMSKLGFRQRPGPALSCKDLLAN